MEKGANTFPFHNRLPYSKYNEGLFLFFLPSLNWIKEKSVATLAIRNICDQTQNKQVSSPTVLQRLYATKENFNKVHHALAPSVTVHAPVEKWMCFPEMGHLIANAYNVVCVDLTTYRSEEHTSELQSH